MEGTPEGGKARGVVSLLTFFGQAKKVRRRVGRNPTSRGKTIA